MADKTFTFNIKAIADMKDVITNVNNIQQALGKLNLPPKLKTEFDSTFSNLTKEVEKYQKLMSNGIKTKGDATTLEKSGKRILDLYQDISKAINSMDNSALKKAFKDLGTDGIENLKNQITDLQKQLQEKIKSNSLIDFDKEKQQLDNIKAQFKEVGKATSEIKNNSFNTFIKNLTGGNLKGAGEALTRLKTKIDNLEDGQGKEALINWLNKITQKFNDLKQNSDISSTLNQLEQIKAQLKGEEATFIQKLIDQFKQGTPAINNMGQELGKLINSTNEWGQAQAQANKELDQVKSRIQYFLGLTNAVNLFKRAIRGAFETVKELDAAMTKTAVVTDFTVSDMWEQLPAYTKRANELGVSTQAVYEAATLYYQQGLNTNEVTALSVETLKMARIAGLEAADATDRMTNALRGFNMELNEQSAQRINDVYSELAARTASDVDEISTAMTKVASLAHSANMEFETTSAFLAQIIETTREAPETAGTALKTVIARFTEVKKLFGEGELKSSDEEGQLIDLNKISSALRIAGIDLNKYFLGEVGLDDIFMELASKWDSLTNIQQRYIATQAAGSRQQSRFIAMMQDYARTQELVSYAYNANGASAKQFEKTQESLASKLAKLKNAWNEFLMGLANNSVIKGATDLLTTLLNIINKITSSLGDGIGSFLKWGAVIGSFAGLRKAFASGGIADKILGSALGNTKLGGLLGVNQAAQTGEKTSLLQKILGFNYKGTTDVTQFSGRQTGFMAFQLFGRDLAANLKKTFSKDGLKNLFKDVPNKFNEVFSKAGQNITTIFTPVKGVISGFASELGITGAALVGFAAITTAAVVAVGLVISEINGGVVEKAQLKRAKQQAEVSASTRENASNQYENLKSNYESYKQLLDQTYNAENQSERLDAQLQLNELVKSMVDENKILAEYMESDSDGNLKFTENLDSLLEKQQQSVLKANQADQLAQANVLMKEAAVLDKKDNIFFNKERREDFRLEASADRTEATKIIQSTLSSLLQDSNIDDEVKSTLVEGLANVFDFSEYQKDIKKASGVGQLFGYEFWHSKNNMRGTYEDLTGIQADESWTNEELATAIAQVNAQNELQDRLNRIAESIGNTEETLNFANMLAGNLDTNLDMPAKQIVKHISDEIDSFSGAEISGHDEYEVVTDYEAYLHEMAEQLGYLPEEFNEFLDDYDLGETVQEASKKIERQQRTIKKQKETFQKQTAATLANSGLTDAAILDRIIHELKSQEQTQLVDLANNLSDYSEDFRTNLLQSVSDSMLNGQWNNSELQSIVSKLSDNPIENFDLLTKAANNGNSAIINLAKSVGAFDTVTNKIDFSKIEGFSKELQVQYFLTSSAFEDLQEQLSDFIDENGKISAKNVKDLSKECSNLDKLLKNNIVSASGLAKAFTALQNGEITFSDLNDRVIETISSVTTLEDIITNTLDYIENFDPGEDWGQAYDFINDGLEKISEFVNNRELGNPQLHNYWKAFFTTDPTDLADWETGIALLKQLQGNGGANFWTDIMGFSMDDNGVIADMQVGSMTGGEYKAWMKERASQNGFGNFSDEFFDMQLTNMANHDYGVVKEFAANEVKAIIDNYTDGLKEGEVSKADIQAIADIYGIDPQEIINAYNEKFNLNLDFSQLEESIRRTATSIQDAYKLLKPDATIRGELDSGWVLSQFGIGPDGSFDVGTLYAKIKEIIPEVADGSISAAEWVQEQIDKSPDKAVELPVKYTTTQKLDDGTFQTTEIDTTVKVKSIEGYEEAVNQIQSEANSSLLASSLVEPISDAQEQAKTFSDFIQGLEAKVDMSAVETAVATVSSNMTSQLEATRTCHVNIVPNQSTISVIGSGGYINFSIAAYASGGEIGSSASGNSKPGLALTGEEKPEIVWNKDKGYAYLAGKDGPEINNLQPGDEIFNGQQTEAILRRSGLKSFAKGTINSYAGTIWKRDDTNNGGSGSGSGDGGNGNGTNWRNELDWLYNLMEDIAELERQQNEFEEKHDLALENIYGTGKDLYNLTKKELNNLYTQFDNQQVALSKRLQEMDELIGSSGYSNYVWWNANDQTLEIDWDAIEAIQDKDTYDEISDLINGAEEVQDQIDDASAALLDIEKEIKEIEKRYLDEYADFQNRVLDAVKASYQAIIDNYSDLSDALNDANNSILNSIQEEIDLERQIRDNTKTEQDITDLQTRLAFLRRDTSGANATEIRVLERQISEALEGYEDTLVGQELNRLSEANNKAEEQRQQQIEILQTQLEYWIEQGILWDEVGALMSEGIDSEGSLIINSGLEKLLKDTENWKSLSETQKQVWGNELITTVNQVGAYLLKISEGMDTISQGVWATIPAHSIAAGKIQYATGGLNTFTGPAWLDGTPSEPEYVLNARQTDAFLRLADVLPSAMNGSNVTNTFGGSVYLNLTMNVDEIGNDYDVDKIADRVKDIIYDASSYRNVNTLNFTR